MKRLGIDPVFFGVIMVVNLSMGLASLPSGATLFFSMIGILLLITFVPSLVLFLPRLVYGR